MQRLNIKCQNVIENEKKKKIYKPDFGFEMVGDFLPRMWRGLKSDEFWGGSRLLNPALFFGTGSVVGDGGDVGNLGHIEVGGPKGFEGGVAA
jgi:hypothetical protein